MQRVSVVYKSVGRDRLLKLADHLEHGQLGHKAFSFEVFNIGLLDEQGCGTLGCAIGECPIVFPEHWMFARNKQDDGEDTADPVLIKCVHGESYRRAHDGIDHAVEFFGLVHGWMSTGLFVPDTAFRIWDDCRRLPKDSAKEDVAESIRQFVDWYDEYIKDGECHKHGLIQCHHCAKGGAR